MENAGNHGLRVTNADGNGVNIDNAVNDGIHVVNAGNRAGYFNGEVDITEDLSVLGNASISGELAAAVLNTAGFQMSNGASPDYVLTSDESGNGTWQALPPAARDTDVTRLVSKLDEMMGIIEMQNEKINLLESKIAVLSKE